MSCFSVQPKQPVRCPPEARTEAAPVTASAKAKLLMLSVCVSTTDVMHCVNRRNYRLGPTGRKAKTDDHRSVRLERPLSAYPKFISSGPDQHLSVPRPPSKSRERMKANGQAEQTVPTPHQSPDRQVAVRTYGRTQRRWQEEASDTLV